MNWQSLSEAVATGVLGCSIAGILLLVTLRLLDRFLPAKPVTVQPDEKVILAAYQRGANAAYETFGRNLAQATGKKIHGFARVCGGCKSLRGEVLAVDEEYWVCSGCKTRNPAPLPADEVESEVAP